MTENTLSKFVFFESILSKLKSSFMLHSILDEGSLDPPERYLLYSKVD